VPAGLGGDVIMSVASVRMQRPLTKGKREFIAGMLFLAPNTIGFLVFTLVPVVASFVLSFYDWPMVGKPSFSGLANFKRMLMGDPKFYTVLWNTFYYTLLYVPTVLVASLGLGMLINRKMKGILAFRVMYYLPVLTSYVAAAMVFNWVFNNDFGLLNYFLRLFGNPGTNWLTNKATVMPCVAFVSVWKNVGRYMIIFMAGLQNIPQQLYEAARIDGAGTVKQFWYVTVPMLSPTTFFLLVTSMIDSFKLFDIVWSMTGGGPADATRTLVTYVYNVSFQRFRMGYGCALSWVLFIIIFLFTMIQMKGQNKWVQYDM
jgi:multiple sugar transport system permease protein